MNAPRFYSWDEEEHDVYCSGHCAQEALSGQQVTGSRDATADEVRAAGNGCAWCRQPLVEVAS